MHSLLAALQHLLSASTPTPEITAEIERLAATLADSGVHLEADPDLNSLNSGAPPETATAVEHAVLEPARDAFTTTMDDQVCNFSAITLHHADICYNLLCIIVLL